MKTTYSRRELYTAGEFLGNSATQNKLGGGRIYGGGGGGGPSGPSQTTVQNTNIPEYARPYVETMLGATQQQLFNTTQDAEGNTQITGVKPYQPYSYNPQDYVAGFSPMQEQSFYGAANLGLPSEYGAAAGLTGAASMGALGAGNQYNYMATNPYAVGAFMNPYVQQSLQPQLNQLAQQGNIAANQAASQATGSGAFGGTRSALAQNLAQQNALMAQQQAIGQGYNQAYNQAQQAMQYGAGLGLQGQQAAIQGAGQLANIGQQRLQGQQGILNLQNQYGQQQQQQQQNIINNAINNYATAQQYPQQQLAFMNSMLRGLPLQTGTTQMYQAAPSPISQLAGLGTTALAGYKLANMAKGGEVKTKRYDVGGSVTADLENMDDMHLMQEAKSSPSAMVRREAAQILAERQAAKGIESAQSNLPAAYAGGGIIAFASGDLIDDEEDDDSTVDYYDTLSAANQAEHDDLLSQYARASGDMPEGIGSIGINLDRPTGSGIRPEAKAPRGLEALEARVIRQESGGRDFDKNGNPLTSPKGAKYAMQVMPATARDPGFGIKPAKDDSPEEYNRVGRELLSKLYQKYDGDEQLTLAAYNWGSGNVDKFLKSGRNLAMVPKETRQYASMAEGGIAGIRHFAKGDYVGFGEEAPYDPESPSIFDIFGKMVGSPLERIKNQTYGKGFVTNEEAQNPYKTAPSSEQMGPPKTAMVDEEADAIAARKEEEARAELEKQKEDEKKAEAETPAAKMQKYLDDIRATITKQRQQDKYMALLAGGLGMMGGTSPHAFANIGQGGMKGIESMLASNKLTGAQEAALTKGQLGAYQLQQNQDARRAIALDNQKKDAYGKMGIIRNNMEKNVKAAMGLDVTANIDDKNILNKIQAEVERRLAGSPEYRGLHKMATGLEYDYGLAGNISSGPLTKDQLIEQAKAEKKRLGLA